MANKNPRRKRKVLMRFGLMAAFVLVCSFGMVKAAEYFMASQPARRQPEATPVPPIQQPNTDISYNGDGGRTINLEVDEIPEIDMIRVPYNDHVDISYFDDVIFMGDSLADGFKVYNSSLKLKDSDAVYLTQKSTSPRTFLQPGARVDAGRGLVDVWRTIEQRQPGKMYLTMGTNALMSLSPEDFVASYTQLVHKIRETSPDTVIYVTTVTPTTVKKAISEPRLSFDRIYQSNLLLAKMCRDEGLGLINLYDVLKNDSGYLRTDIAARDGYHLTPAGYGEWLEYLITHTLYHPSYPYI